MATQPKLEQSDDNQILTRLTGVETQLAAVETQLKGVETRLTVVETDLAVVKSNYATKEDIAKLQHSISSGDDKLEIKMAQMETRLIKWFVGTAVTLSAVVGTIAFSVARFIH
jgi:septal ring factor EnvC (AmiA/AmiB activator)